MNLAMRTYAGIIAFIEIIIISLIIFMKKSVSGILYAVSLGVISLLAIYWYWHSQEPV